MDSYYDVPDSVLARRKEWMASATARKVDLSKHADNKKGRKLFRFSVIALLLLSVAGIYKVAMVHPLFDIKHLEVSGIDRLSNLTVKSLIGNSLTGNIFRIDLVATEKALKENPWVKSISIIKRIPATILLNIEERKPIALVEGGDKKFLMDSDGILLEEVESATGFLRVVGFSGSMTAGMQVDSRGIEDAMAISRLFENDTLFHDKIVSVDLNDIGLIKVNTKDGIKVLFGPDRLEWDEKFLEYLTVRKILLGRGQAFKAMDLSFKGQVVVN